MYLVLSALADKDCTLSKTEKLYDNDRESVDSLSFLYQLYVILNCLLDFLRLNADVPLRGSCAAVLKEPLH